MPTTIDGGTGASQIQNGTVTEAKIAAGAVTGTKIAAGAVTETKIADGAVTAAKLAVGVISTTSVLAATAGATAGAVGTYCTAVNATNDIAIGSTIAGSSLRGINNAGAYASPGFGGTWRNMGASAGNGLQSIGSSSLWLRIS